MIVSNWRRRLGHALLFIASLPVSGCATQLSHEQFRRLQNWLICDECINGEREYVDRIGTKAVGKLDSALIGPSPERVALMRAKLGDSFRFANKPGGDSNAYINPRLSNYIATYQKRAAVSLGDIGSDRAKAALDRAIRDSAARGYRSDVVRVIRDVRANVGAVSFGGRIKPGQLSFGEVVTVIAPPGQHFTSQDHAAIADSPFPPNQIPFTRVGDTLRFLAVGSAGPHVVVVTDPARAGATSVGRITITSLLDATDRAMLSCSSGDITCAVVNAPQLLDTTTAASATIGGATPSCRAGGGACVVPLPRVMAARLMPSSPVTIFLALSRIPPRPDTVDFLKIEPPTNLALTALLDWRGPANLDLAWRTCSPFTPVATAAVAGFASAESTSVFIPARECWILQVSMGAGGDGPAFARLRITTP